MTRNRATHHSISPDEASRPVSPEEVYAHMGEIMEVAKRFRWDYDSRKDLVQEVAIKCWQNPKIRFELSKGTLAAYLARIAKNTAIEMWRKKQHIPLSLEDVELVAMAENEMADMEDEERRTEQKDLLKRGIEEMYRKYPSTQAIDAFLMFFMDGLPARQVADKLAVTESFVNMAVFRGMKRLVTIVRQLEEEDNRRDAC